MLRDKANQNLPQRSTTMVAKPRARPTGTPQPRMVRRWVWASAKAGRISGLPGLATASPKTALRKKLAAVMAVMARMIGTSRGPRKTWNSLPCRTWTFRSSMAAQIHMAGRIWTRVSRQLVNRSLTPWKSMAKAPTTRARGASQRLRRLRASTASSTICSSPSLMARTRLRTSWPTAWRRFRGWVLGVSGPVGVGAPGAPGVSVGGDRVRSGGPGGPGVGVGGDRVGGGGPGAHRRAPVPGRARSGAGSLTARARGVGPGIASQATHQRWVTVTRRARRDTGRR